MRTFTVITSSIGGKLAHEIYDFFIPKEHKTKNRGWYLPLGGLEIPLGERDMNKLLVTNWKKIMCPSRNERKWHSNQPLQPLVCSKCGEKFGEWRKYTIGFECFHPNQGEIVLNDKVIKDAFCLKLRDRYTGEYNGKSLLVAPDKEQAEALIYWKLWDHVPIFPDDRRIIASDTWLFSNSHYLIALKPGSSFIAIKAHQLPANYTLELAFGGSQIRVTKKVLTQEQEVTPAQEQAAP